MARLIAMAVIGQVRTFVPEITSPYSGPQPCRNNDLTFSCGRPPERIEKG